MQQFMILFNQYHTNRGVNMATFRTLEHPNSIFWEITDKCNHNCIHCFNYWRSDTQRSIPCAKPMSKKHMEQILSKIIA